MKKRKFRYAVLSLCLAALLIANSSIKAFAANEKEVILDAENKISFPEDESIINTPILPGDVIKRAFVIRNNSSQTVAFYMSSNMNVTDANGQPIRKVDGKDFKEDLIRKLQLTIKKVDGTILYHGPASGDVADAGGDYQANFGTADIQDGFLNFSDAKGIGLGGVASGESLTLIAILTVPGKDFGNEYQNCYSLFNWSFYCEGDYIPIEPTASPNVPQVPELPNVPESPDTPDIPGTSVTPIPTTTETPVETATPEPELDIDGNEIPGGNANQDKGDSGDQITDIPEDEIILEPEIPEAPVEIEIDDNDVPTGGIRPGGLLAKTGFQVLYFKEVAIVLICLVAGLVVVQKLKRKKNE